MYINIDPIKTNWTKWASYYKSLDWFGKFAQIVLFTVGLLNLIIFIFGQHNLLNLFATLVDFGAMRLGYNILCKPSI